MFAYLPGLPDRILSVNANIDTIGDILVKIIPTLEEVSDYGYSLRLHTLPNGPYSPSGRLGSISVPLGCE